MAKYLTYGASPRATIGMIEGARALAMLRGRRYVLPEDMTDLVPDVMRHRLVLSYEALAEGLTPDAGRQRDEEDSPAPDKPLAARRRRSRPELKPPMAEIAPATCTPIAGCEKLEWTVIRRLDGLLQGDYRTLLARRRRRPGRPARIPVARRRAPHRLERHRAAADALRAPVHRRPRPGRVVPARPVRQRRLRLRRRHQAGRVQRRFRRHAGACVLTRHGNRVGAMLYGTRGRWRDAAGAAASARAEPAAAHDALAPACRRRGTGHALADLLRTADGSHDQAPLARCSSSPTSSATPGWA